MIGCPVTFSPRLTRRPASATRCGHGQDGECLGISITGVDAGNYTFNTTASTTADITARGLVVTATGINKVYDGMTTATVTLSDDRVSGDVFTTSYAVASFGDKNVGTGKPVSVSGISIAGVRRGQLHLQHDGEHDGGHHRSAVDDFGRRASIRSTTARRWPR
jgi:hypothetical protein